MQDKDTAVFGRYETRGQVEQAINALLAVGFEKEDVSVLFPENAGAGDFAIAGISDTGTYAGAIAEGGILLSVHCQDSESVPRAKDLMQKAGGQGVAATGEAPVGDAGSGNLTSGAGRNRST